LEKISLYEYQSTHVEKLLSGVVRRLDKPKRRT
jgi:hypothetical protein